jgi:hypothetical protein
VSDNADLQPPPLLKIEKGGGVKFDMLFL